MSSGAPTLVLGGGLAGLSAATALAEDGRRVVLLEGRGSLGGRALFPMIDGSLPEGMSKPDDIVIHVISQQFPELFGAFGLFLIALILVAVMAASFWLLKRWIDTTSFIRVAAYGMGSVAVYWTIDRTLVLI